MIFHIMNSELETWKDVSIDHMSYILTETWKFNEQEIDLFVKYIVEDERIMIEFPEHGITFLILTFKE